MRRKAGKKVAAERGEGEKNRCAVDLDPEAGRRCGGADRHGCGVKERRNEEVCGQSE